MASNVELLGTDLFREHHRIIRQELSEIEAELEHVQSTQGTWREAVPTLRRLLILLEADVERHAEEEEHLLYGPLGHHLGGLTPTLSECYREHRDLRLEVEGLRHELMMAFSGRPPTDDALFTRSNRLIGLLRGHMAREDEVLFLAAEQELTHEDLIRMAGPPPLVTPVRQMP
jgi:hemerythrin-like domain-containing protein